MIDRPTLLIDTDNLAHRAFHSPMHVSHKGKSVSAIFGVLRDLATLGGLYHPRRIAFCFDSDTSLRVNEFPYYKKTRRQRLLDDPEYVKQRQILAEQINILRLEVLPALGFGNLFRAEGYEADDVLASAVWECTDPVVLVSNDRDLFQLLDDLAEVRIYNPLGGVVITEKSFRQMHNIAPHRWREVKALAGCGTDDVPGADGVGEKTAIRYLRGELKETTKAHARIMDYLISPQYAQSLKLVRLPYPGCPVFAPGEATVDPGAWDRVCGGYGFTSLLGRCPMVAGSTG